MRYRVVEIYADGWNVHTDDLDKDEASDLQDHLNSTFPIAHFFVEPYEHVVEEERHYNENAVDGWEDMHPDRDY